MIMFALDSCSVRSKLRVSKSSNRECYVEICEGNEFQVNRSLQHSLQQAKDANILCIDGYIESVSEIHHLLERMSETKETYVIFSRGYSPDVVHTIKVNNDRRTLFALLYTVPYDVENANTLVDIATISGIDVISSLRGDLISSIDLDKLARIEEVRFFEEKVILKNGQGEKRSNLIRERLKREIEERPEIREILERRIERLTSSYVDIVIPDDVSFSLRSSTIDEAIRSLSSFLSHRSSIEDLFDSYYKDLHRALECKIVTTT